MEERDTIESQAEQPVAETVIEPVATAPPEPEEPANPDAWLQWALIIGILALFLICALVILIGWNNR